MAEALDSATSAQEALARFEERTSPAGRLALYARGRLRTLWLRQTLTAFGSLTIALLADPGLGALLALLALSGEAFEAVLLRWALTRLELGETRQASRLALLGAGVQGLTIAGCVALTWRLVPLHEAQFFAVGFLYSAVINAGLSRALFRPACDIRLVLFLATGLALFSLDYLHEQGEGVENHGFFAATLCLLAYISLLFIRILERHHAQRRTSERALLTEQLAQERARAALARAVSENQRLALVAKYAHDSILITAPDERILWVNDAFTRLTGYRFEEAVGQRPAELLNAEETDPATLARLSEARRSQTPVRAEILNRTKTGQLVWMETSLTPILDAHGQHAMWIAVERDISQAKEREEELARARIAAEEAGQAKSRFLANMSHEIRTPMNGVIGVAELLAETRLTRLQEGYVGTILESGRALLAIINDILDLAKLQSGKAELERRPFSPRACIEGVLRILGPEAAKKGLELRLDGPAADGFVLGDEGKLRQIILNLVGNAVKFTPAGAVLVRLRLPDADGDAMEIEVEDTGIGIAPDRIAAIFESFSQADEGIGRRFGGTGLGLTICAMLAERMGGGISVRSEIGRGSVFTLRASLPPASAPARTAPPRPAALPDLPKGLRVLVAEDNRTNMLIVRKMLGGAATQVIEAVNGEEAVALFRELRPDLVLMDVSMPLKDGLQATREIRAFEAASGLPPCPVIALTANAFGEDREACRAAGLDGFLVKPLSRADLLAAIAAHLNAPPAAARAMGL